MFCGNCGAAVEPDDAFCRTCGARFVEPAEGAPMAAPVAESVPAPTDGRPPSGQWDDDYLDLEQPRRSLGRPLAIGIVFASIVIAGIVAFAVWGSRNNSSSVAVVAPSSAAPADESLPQVATTATLPPTVTSAALPTTIRPASTSSSPPTTAARPPTTAGGPITVPPATATIPTATTSPRTTQPSTSGPTTSGPTTTGPTTTGPATTGPATTGSLADRLASARGSSIRADNSDACGNPTSYQPLNVVDGRNDTAWMVDGDGVGATMTLTLKSPTAISSVGLLPGYAKQDTCSGADRFLQTRRLLEVRWTFDGAAPLTQTFDPASATMQRLSLPSSVKATTVTITIVRTTAPGNPPLDYAAIAEITLG